MSLYDDPALYELIHSVGTDAEVDLLERLFERHGNGGRRALEPACGTGRYLQVLSERGWKVLGYDRSAKMVAFARRRLKDKAAVVVGDMERFRPKERFDLAFNLLSTFRHLMSDRSALAHLRASHAALAPGGIYVLGLDLARYGKDEPDEETWTAMGYNHVLLTLPAERRTRRERILNFITRPGRRLVESSYDLRSYDARELGALLRASPFKLGAAYALDGRPARLSGPDAALWLVLGKKGETSHGRRRRSRRSAASRRTGTLCPP